MIRALILTRGDQKRLANTLSSLIPGFAEGVLRDGVVVDPQGSNAIEELTDEAGCAYRCETGDLISGLSAGLADVKGEWVLCLTDDIELEPGWYQEAHRYIERQGRVKQAAAIFPITTDQNGFAGRLTGWIAGVVMRSRGVHNMRSALLIRCGDFKQLTSAGGGLTRSGGLRPFRLRGRSLQQDFD